MPGQPNFRKLQAYPQEVEKTKDTIFWQQRGKNWFEMREAVPVTGSQLHRAIGLNTLKEAKQLYKNRMEGTPLPEPSDKIKEAMKKGVEHEPNVVATICGKFFPAFFPTWELREVGCKVIDIGDGTLIVDSPDGAAHTLSSPLQSPVTAAIEIKHTTTDLPKVARHYNLIQCFAHCKALESSTCYLFYHTEQSTVMFKVCNSPDLWNDVCLHINQIYGPEGQPPKKVSPELKEMREKIKRAASEVEIVAEFKSTYAVDAGSYIRNEDDPYFTQSTVPDEARSAETTSDSVMQAITATECALEAVIECQELSKPMAKEVLEFIACDIDRSWSRDSVYGSPVAYFFKSASFPEAQANKVVESVLQECHEHDVYVPLTSADGAFEYMVARTVDGKPNTKLSFQKQLWKEVRKLDKKSLATAIILMTEDAWSPTSGCAKVKCSRNEDGLSIERMTKHPSPTTASWAFRAKPAAAPVSEETTEHWYDLFLTNLPEEVRETFRNFCTDNPALMESLQSGEMAQHDHTARKL
ncbi:uncharacterized protein LOC144879386 [Branchiostoma floridae x Branchiostoma japonicum]